MKKISKLAVSLLIPQLAGGIGGIFTARSVNGWYQTIQKPPLNPPAWVFGPVWTALFLLMGYSLYLVWASDAPNKKPAYIAFAVQLALNVLWSIIFFGFYNPGGALVEIIFLWLSILATIILFFKISRASAWFLAPYFLWVTFAVYLNFSLWKLN